ncbi:MAG: Vir family protein [Mycoplasmoidaceae bacterium]|nr:Vir family protein [Mycoplasmoidaceae bacterium]
MLIAMLIVGWHISLFFAPFVAGFLLYQFTKVRNFTLRKIAERNKNKIVTNYDEIDEQELEGINKFTKHIPIAHETKKEVTNDK